MARTKNTARAPRTARSAAHAAPDPAPAPGTSPVPGSAAAAVHAALTASPGATTAAIADAAGVSRPAARDALAALEAAGEADRTRGGRPGIADTWTLAASGPLGTEPAGPGHDDDHAVTGQRGADPADAEQDAARQEQVGGTPAHADGDPEQGTQSGGDPADGDPAEGSPAGEDAAASHEQDQTDPPADDTAPAGIPSDPALVAQVAGHIEQIQAAASAAATALAGGADLSAARTSLDEIYEQAAQARRVIKAAVGGKKAPAARPGGLREKVLTHLRDHPGQSFTPHEIHKVNGHSSGAIANALETLVKHGDAEVATEKPRRFRLAGGTAAPAEPAAQDAGAGEQTDLAGAA
jgi:FaeA-like protein